MVFTGRVNLLVNVRVKSPLPFWHRALRRSPRFAPHVHPTLKHAYRTPLAVGMPRYRVIIPVLKYGRSPQAESRTP